MLMGMTGFGRAHFKDKNIELNLQVRSVNSRYFETAFHLPSGLIYLEDDIKKYLHKKIRRGRITFHLSVNGVLPSTVRANNMLARQYVKLLDGLKKELSLSGDISLAQLSGFPGVLVAQESVLPAELIQPTVEKLLSSACGGLLAMRVKEGEALAKDILARLSKIEKKASFIKRRLSLFVTQKRKQAKEKTNTDEISALIKDCDISEEITRLAFHLKTFIEKVKARNNQHSAIGKELDFISQEMQREANTMGAKSQDVNINSAVIEIKSQIEKIREQLQNVE